MDTRVFCVYNVARGAFLSSKVTVADGENQPLTILKVLVGGLAIDSKSGLWLSPLHGMPAVPRLFPFDLLYLDHELRVIALTEFVPGAEFPPYVRDVASALILPSQSLQSTLTERGDCLLICPADEMESQIAVLRPGSSFPVPTSPFTGENPGQSARLGSEPAPKGASSFRRAPSVKAGAAVAVAEELSQSASRSKETVPSPGISLPKEPVSTAAMTAIDAGPDVAASTQPEKVNRAGLSKDYAEVPKSVLAAIGIEPIAETAAGEKTESVRSAGKPGIASEVETPVISITEVVLEKPHAIEPQTIVGGHGEVLHGDIDDLFSNWMDTPTLASTWKERSEPLRQLTKSPTTHPVVDAPSTDPNAAVPSQAAVALPDKVSDSASSVSSIAQVEQVEIDPQSKAAAMDANGKPEGRPIPSPLANAEAPAAESPNAAPLKAEPESSKTEPEPSKAVSPAVAVSPVSTPVHVSLPQPKQASTSTVAQYGLWRASVPTAVLPVAPARKPLEEQAVPAPSATLKEVTKTTADPAKEGTSKASSSSPKADPPVSAAPQSQTETGERRLEEPKQPLSQASADVRLITKKFAMPGPDRASEAVSRRPSIPDNFLSADEKRKPLSRIAAAATQDKSTAEVPLQPPTGRIPDAETAVITQALAADAVDTVQRKLGIGQANALESTNTVSVEKAEPVRVQKASAGESVEPAKRVTATDLVTGSESLPQGHGSLTLPETENGAQNGTLKAPARHADLNGKVPAPARTFAERFKRWLNPTTPTHSDRRRAHRRYVPGMVAHYYTGGAPKPHDIADISMTGFYLLTEDRWMPDTMIQMTLQKPCAKGERKQSITVLSRIVRRGSDGVAAQFVMPESLDPHSHDVQPSQTTDRFALARFI